MIRKSDPGKFHRDLLGKQQPDILDDATKPAVFAGC